MVTDDASPDVETGVVDVDAEREPCGVEGRPATAGVLDL